MMKRGILFVTLFLLTLSGCGLADKKKALEFNNKIAGYSLNLQSKGKELGEAIVVAAQTKDFSKVKTLAADIKSYVTEADRQAEAMDNVAGSEKLKAANLDFLRYEKTLVDKGIMPFAAMDASTTTEQVQQAFQQLTDESKEEDVYVQRVRVEQQAYAAKNGFKIDSVGVKP